MTQADLAARIGLERTALVRVELGERKVSAMELVAIEGALDRPVDWFFVESPVAVVSRRRDLAVGGFSRALDRALELTARDVAFLEGRHLLSSADRPPAREAPEASRMPSTLPAAYAPRRDGQRVRCWTFSRLRRAWGCWGFPSRLAPMLAMPPTSRSAILA